MAGGEGTRLRPLTSNVPKPMIPVVNRPMMEHVVRLLERHGFDDIVVTLAFLPQAIRSYFGDGSELGVRLTYATEQVPLGTAGSVLHAREQLTERFLVISGDVLTDIDLSEVIGFHERHGALATLALRSSDDPLEFGIVITAPDGRVQRFLEKPTWGEVFSDTINTGIFVLEPEVLDHIPMGRPSDFSGEVFPSLLATGGVFGVRVEGYWEDVGTLDAYLRAHRELLRGQSGIAIPGFHLRRGVWLGKGAEIDPSATIEAPAVIGDFARVGPRARVGPGSVLGANVQVGDGALVEQSVVHDDAFVGPQVSLRGCVLGRSSDVRRRVRCEEGVVIGDRCRLGEEAVIAAGVKIYPSKTVEAGAVVNASVVWESRASRSLFSAGRIKGLANVDIGPELAVRLSMAYAATLPKGSKVVASRDTSRAARVLKRALLVGLNASGIHADDLEAASVPITSFGVRASRAQGGVSVRLLSGDPQAVEMRFFGEDGLDLDATGQRKIERLLAREEFRRALAGEIGDLDFPARMLEHYTASLCVAVDLEAIRRRRFKLVLDYASGTASFVMPNVLAKLGGDVLAVNPFAATTGSIHFDRPSQVARVADLVRASGADLGALFEPAGETLSLVDDAGRVLSIEQAQLAVLRLVLAGKARSDVALTVSAPRLMRQLCEEAGACMHWAALHGTPSAGPDHPLDIAIGSEGGFAFPDFLPAFDATATLAKVLSMLATSGRRLSEVVDMSPVPHIARGSLATPWASKGLLMRTVQAMAREQGGELVVVDGVRIDDRDGWSLVVCDADEPVTRVVAEDCSDAAAQARVSRLIRRMRAVLAGA